MKTDHYVICTHPEHNSVLEIMTKHEFRKMVKLDPKYECLSRVESKEMALYSVWKALQEMAQGKEDFSQIKQKMKAWYEKE